MKKAMKVILSIMVSVAILAGCGKDEASEKIIKMGVSAGPYNELFDVAITPILEKNGYKVENIEFRALLDSNIAMLEDGVDVVVAQHAGYMKVFNEQRGTDLVAIQKIPTVPAAVFSKRFESLNDVKEGMTVLIPMDASNAARAYGLLQKIGWIQLTEGLDLMKASKLDVISNPYNLEIKEIDSTLIPRVLEEADFAVIPGSIVWLGKMDPSKALAHEELLPDLYLQVVVRDKSKDSEWAKAIIDAYNSEEFKAYLSKNNPNNYWAVPKN